MFTFTIDAEKYDEKNIDKIQLQQLINKHNRLVNQIKKNIRYYEGKHIIKNRKKKTKGASNNKVVCNHAKDISDTATGFFMNSPISFGVYDEKDDISKLTDAFDLADTDDVDSDNAHDMSVTGVAYEYVYVKEDTTQLAIKNIEPDHTFLVYDDTIEQNLLFGVYYYRFKDAINDSFCYRATVGTENFKYEFIIECSGDRHRNITERPEPHFLGGVPIIEYKNNKLGMGEFEQQLSLIDAYNTLMSDRVNDKEQFVESLLVIYGNTMGDDEDEVSEAMKILKKHGLLELPADGKAEYISRTLDENGMETLRKAIKEDIYTFSHVPNLTDENFVGNSSGVAMEYKLLGLEMITKEKEKYYKKGLKRRIELFCNYLNLKAIAINPNIVKITFSRKLPKNMSELAQMITNLKGTVSQKTLISQLDFVEDAESEIETVKAESEENLRQQQELFKTGYNIPFDKNNDVDENKEEINNEEKLEN